MHSYERGALEKPESAVAALSSDLQNQCSSTLSNATGKVLLIIDGCDEYYRDPQQSQLDGALATLLRNLVERHTWVKPETSEAPNE
jgi:hypothetical protein